MKSSLASKHIVCLFLSQAVVVDRTMYISGQLGLDVASSQLVDGGVQAQAKQVRLTGTGDDDNAQPYLKKLVHCVFFVVIGSD